MDFCSQKHRVSLFLKYERTKKTDLKIDLDTKVTGLTTQNVVGQTDFNASREISKDWTLEAGTYSIIPSTFYAQKETTWLLRVYVQTDEGDEVKIYKNSFNLCRKMSN